MRVSTHDQNVNLQKDALVKAGCDLFFEDAGVAGSVKKREGLDAALSELKAGDAFVVWRLDRLGRSLQHLIEMVGDIDRRGAQFISLTENINTQSAGGRLIFHVLGALAEFERCLIRERTIAGQQAAKKRGQHIGRRRKLTVEQVRHAKAQIALGCENLTGMALLFGVDRSTLWRALRRLEQHAG